MINGIGLEQAQCWQALCKCQHCEHTSVLTLSTFSIPISHLSGTDSTSPVPNGLLFFWSTQQLEWSWKGCLASKAWDALPLLLYDGSSCILDYGLSSGEFWFYMDCACFTCYHLHFEVVEALQQQSKPCPSKWLGCIRPCRASRPTVPFFADWLC